MIALILALSAGLSPQAPQAPAGTNYVVSIVTERAGDDFSVRFVLSGPPTTYSAVREGDEILIRIAAEPLPSLTLPSPSGPIRTLVAGPTPGFSLRLTLAENWTHEMVRESSALRLVLRAKPEARPAAAASPTPDPLAIPSPSPTPSPSLAPEAVASDTEDLYRRLFPSTTDPTMAGAGGGTTEVGSPQNWYSDFRWLGLQVRPWVSVSYVDGKTTQVQTGTVTADSYWVIQPNLGLGFEPPFGGPSGGHWSLNYTPRFRRMLNLDLPRLTSHFFDAAADQPIGSRTSLYANYHFSKGVLETDEIDPGREYGIGLNRVIDTSLERFRRNTFGFGARLEVLVDTQIDLNVSKTRVRYGNDPGEEQFVFGERAFFDYDARTLNVSLRRGLGESRFLGLVFGVHDTPAQKERKQVEGRGYTYGASFDGEIAALTSGRIQLGYRTQKDPNAGLGGREYKDLAYAAQLVREMSEDTKVGVGADRRLYLSAYEDNGFYVADALRGDVSTRLPFAVFMRGGVSLQTNSYKASPQLSETTGAPTLRKDKIRAWFIGVSRTLTSWAFLRFDYNAERRNSNLDRFDINSRSVTFQLGIGFFGKPGRQPAPSW